MGGIALDEVDVAEKVEGLLGLADVLLGNGFKVGSGAPEPAPSNISVSFAVGGPCLGILCAMAGIGRGPLASLR